MAKMAYRYVEIHYFLPDLIERQFRAVVTEADSPKNATLEAKRNTFREHPKATNVEEFMQRMIDKNKADEISERMRNGDWHGWFEQDGSDSDGGDN